MFDQKTQIGADLDSFSRNTLLFPAKLHNYSMRGGLATKQFISYFQRFVALEIWWRIGMTDLCTTGLGSAGEQSASPRLSFGNVLLERRN